IDMLEKSGIQFYFLNKPRFPFLIYRLNMRNHRKITVIDLSLIHNLRAHETLYMIWYAVFCV
ncbi:hypothetical protein ACQ4LK_25680, partial [Bacillus pumilus]